MVLNWEKDYIDLSVKSEYQISLSHFFFFNIISFPSQSDQLTPHLLKIQHKSPSVNLSVN